jgi:hypothetical protein
MAENRNSAGNGAGAGGLLAFLQTTPEARPLT